MRLSNGFAYAMVGLLSLPALGHGELGQRQALSLQWRDFRVGMQGLRNLAQTMDIDVAGYDMKQGIVDVMVAPDAVTHVLALPGGVSVLAPTMSPLLMSDLDNRYFNEARMKQALDAVVAQHPSLASVVSIGKSVEGRDIWAIKLGTSQQPASVVLFNGMHHAREVMTTEVNMDIVRSLSEGYAQDAKVKQWLDNTDVWVVPMLNPDGNAKVWGSNNLWRKNTRSPYGVDLNRNYPYAWGSCEGSSGFEFSETYRGPSAGSEPEAQALMNLVARVKPAYDISFHSYSELIVYPYGCDGEHAEDREAVESLGQALGQAMVSDDGRGHYTAGTAWETLYSADGLDIDWMYHEHRVLAYTIELNGRQAGFQPPYAMVQPTVEKAHKAWGLILDRSISNPRPL